MVIQWFPGHMAKAKRQAIENRKMVDIVIELVDARLPISSRNPLMDEIAGNKPRLLILNKGDLADPEMTREWMKYYNGQDNQNAIAISAMDQNDIKQTKKVLKTMMAPKMAALAEKGVKPRAIRLMVLGIPNVGKSTFINQMIKKNRAQTANKPGVTKAQQWLKIENDFELLDTPGILWHKFEDEEIGLKLALSGAIKDTIFHNDDVALFALKFFLSHYPTRITEAYKVKEKNWEDSLPELLMEITKKMNFGEDYERGSEKLIFDIRDGKLGTYTLDDPPISSVQEEVNQ